MNIASRIETILFVASKPLLLKKIIKALDISEEDALNGIEILKQKYNQLDSGVTILDSNKEYQLVSNPENRESAELFLKAEVTGELTKPQLETLTVVSYCGPITKPELEQIRGVNCGIILRNLLVRGLVKENTDSANLLPTFEVSIDYLKHLGISSVSELPDYEALHDHDYVIKILEDNIKE